MTLVSVIGYGGPRSQPLAVPTRIGRRSVLKRSGSSLATSAVPNEEMLGLLRRSSEQGLDAAVAGVSKSAEDGALATGARKVADAEKSEIDEARFAELREKLANQRASALVKLRAQMRKGLKESAADAAADISNENAKASAAVAPALAAVSAETSGIINRLVVGDLVIHRKVGVGRFRGIRNAHGVDYAFIQFADGLGKVKTEEADRALALYGNSSNAADDGTVVLGRLGKSGNSRNWSAKQTRARAAVEKMVFSMLDLYVARQCQRRPRYALPSPELLEAFKTAFPYVLTIDQNAAIQDIYSDMMSQDAPMDRLICGDVGFGKTEAALHAIFLAASSSTSLRQVMVLAPTTILALQHYHLISSRLEPFGIRCGVLTRLQKASERKTTTEAANNGEIHVLIGTHALLSKKLSTKRLSLLVIDEEQRFGVRQKETLAALRKQGGNEGAADVLTLSATPIPRTLHMATSGLRDCSLITTPPPGRLPIEVNVRAHDPEVVREYISREMDREGQVFYVVPKIKLIPDAVAEIRILAPDARIESAHGRMKASELEDVMRRVQNRQVDILICTTIVENGLDLPYLNTIVITYSHMLGLAQLHQLRGRVGRSPGTQAFALVTYPEEAKGRITEKGMKRLKVLESCRGLGDGFELAEQDLNIRGAGAVFGEMQSGVIEGVGTEMYMEMLYQALQRVEHQTLPKLTHRDIRIHFGEQLCIEPEHEVQIQIPHEFIEEESSRASAEEELNAASTQGPSAMSQIGEQIRGRHGNLPAEVQRWLRVAWIRHLAASLGIFEIIIVEKEKKRRSSPRTSVGQKFNKDSENRQVVMLTEMSLGLFSSVWEKASIVTREMITYKEDPADHDRGRIIVELRPPQLETADTISSAVLRLLIELKNCLPAFMSYV